MASVEPNKNMDSTPSLPTEGNGDRSSASKKLPETLDLDSISSTLKISIASSNEEELPNVETILGLASIKLHGPLPEEEKKREVGERWDKYNIIRLLKEDETCSVMLAEDRNMHRAVVLKIFPHSGAMSKEMSQRCLEEAQILAQLEHPHIVSVYDLGINSTGQVYYSMRYLPAPSLNEHIQLAHQPANYFVERIRKLLRTMVLIGQAVGYAHERQVLHRYLTPDNILLGNRGEAMLIGWSLCRAKQQGIEIFDTTMARAMRTSGFLKTIQGRNIRGFHYRPAEMIEGYLELVDEYSDIYSLGAILYEILVGTPPAFAENLQDSLKQIAAGQFPLPRRVPRPLQAIVKKAMAKKKKERYTSAYELADDLQRFLEKERVNACPYGLWQRLRAGGKGFLD